MSTPISHLHDQPTGPAVRIISGPDSGTVLALGPDRERVVIGRSEDADLPLADVKASREHAELVPAGSSYRLEDLGSRNGTQLNGVPVAEAVVLTSGDRIVIGLTEIEFINPDQHLPTRLHILEGPGAGEDVALERPRLEIGPPGDADIGLDDPAIDAICCAIVMRDAGHFIVDLGTGPGIAINDRPLEEGSEAWLRPGDCISIAGIRMEYREASSADPFGDTFLDYALGRRIGSGSLGTVYRATKHGGQEAVALKFLSRAHLREPAVVARFINAGRTLQRFTSEQPDRVVHVARADIAGGQPYIEMEWLPRGSLAERLSISEPLPVSSVLSLAREVAQGLGAAADAGLFHNGLHPGNILFDATGAARVADLGLCLGTQLAADPIRSPYVSPEEREGQPPDARSNQYSLGVIIHQALTGRPPDPVSMSHSPAHLINPKVPAALSAVVGRMLTEDALARHGSWAEVTNALEGLRALIPSSAPALVQEARPPRRRPVSTRAIPVYRPGWADHVAENLGVPRLAVIGTCILAAALVVICFVLPLMSGLLAKPPAATAAAKAGTAPDPSRPQPSPAEGSATPSTAASHDQPATAASTSTPAAGATSRSPEAADPGHATQAPEAQTTTTAPANGDVHVASPAAAPLNDGRPWRSGALTLVGHQVLHGQYLVQDRIVIFRDRPGADERRLPLELIENLDTPPVTSAVAATAVVPSPPPVTPPRTATVAAAAPKACDLPSPAQQSAPQTPISPAPTGSVAGPDHSQAPADGSPALASTKAPDGHQSLKRGPHGHVAAHRSSLHGSRPAPTVPASLGEGHSPGGDGPADILDRLSQTIVHQRPVVGLAPDLKALFLGAWGQTAVDATSAERARWTSAADQVGMVLPWDDEAQSRQRLARTAAEMGRASPTEVIDLYRQAIAAGALLGDTDYVDLAKAYQANRDRTSARATLSRLTPLGSRSAAALELKRKLSIDGDGPDRQP